MEEKRQPMRNLYLIGFMGVGKSHFGRIVSDALNYQFFDTDHVIENNEETTISEIFKYHGEDYFRKLERDLIVGRTSEGREAAMAKGVKFGRPAALSLKQVKEIKKRKAKGENISQLARAYDVGRPTIYRALG